ncbi:sel1 repeat family protein [Streptomyces sp. So13.3]|uniref:tetratricopeptide repeat protein n=1 Tax=unclassified Streptomyces TaxID=2593676 RepID=UPI00164E0B97|nr:MULTISPECIES: tetratricopeptide repeat protein [unclassified Streptomyces]MCZ4100631.1 tetratricopeptide repeat protein [Streptomyces sp. H39-C1]QNA71828.1 sel1 repeat family protein [Streptomyces sp. So13.3]
MLNWRLFPVGISVEELVKRAEDACDRGDLIGAGNWYFHAKRRGAMNVGVKIASLVPALELAVGQGSADAKALLAAVLLDQRNDLGRAACLFGEASDAGVLEGMRELGFMLTKGIGLDRDAARANVLFRQAADAGDGYSAFNLSVNYYHGVGVARNFREFSRWLQLAADLGIPEACAVLGDQLAKKGREDESLDWYVRAARSGHAPAMFAAAGRYRDGIGCEPDLVQAVRWYLAMLDRGSGDGIHEAIKLVPSMTPEQIVEAGRLSGRNSEAETLLGSS